MWYCGAKGTAAPDNFLPAGKGKVCASAFQNLFAVRTSNLQPHDWREGVPPKRTINYVREQRAPVFRD
jgi:hypothetical protein